MKMQLGACAVVIGLAISTGGCADLETSTEGESQIDSETSTEGESQIDSVTSALTTTYQAENAFDLEEGVVETVNAGYTGSGYVNINNFSDTFAWYIIHQPTAKTVSVTVRYANGTNVNRPIDVQNNGRVAARVAGAPTGSWSTWRTATVNVPMGAGNNDFILRSVTADGMPNIDSFTIVN